MCVDFYLMLIFTLQIYASYHKFIVILSGHNNTKPFQLRLYPQSFHLSCGSVQILIGR